MLQEVINPTKLQNCQFMHVNWFSTVSLKPKSTPYTHTAQQRWHRWISLTPRWNTDHGPLPSLSSSRSFQGGNRRASPSRLSYRSRGLGVPQVISSISAVQDSVASTRANPPWWGTLVEACSSRRSERFSLFSVAENWAPLINKLLP